MPFTGETGHRLRVISHRKVYWMLYDKTNTANFIVPRGRRLGRVDGQLHVLLRVLYAIAAVLAIEHGYARALAQHFVGLAAK